jgi:hypothetical protein
MKKCILLTAIILGCLLSFAGHAQQTEMCGDVNNDGSVNIVDALILAKCYIGAEICPSATIGNVDCNDAINIIDALRVAQYYVGIVLSLSCCAGNTTTVWIGVYAGYQCEPLDYPTLSDAVQELRNNGITVLTTFTLSSPVCAACGCPDGRTWLAQIRSTDLNKAIALGWFIQPVE